tara:strand:+ start:1405 stop:2388 length:984 start_codon:yes stop_codon:yes gene_type:complete
MIAIKSPLRITIAGGGTDLPWWYKKNGGLVISSSINRFVNIVGFKRNFDKKIFLSYSRIEVCNKIKEIKNEIIKICFQKFKINSSIEIHSISEVPGGSGLGSSGAFTASLIKFLAEYKKIKMSRQQIANMACDVEMKSLKRSSGKQDAFMSVFGGFQEIKINKKGAVKIKKLKISKKNIRKFKDSTLTYFTGITRDSETILKSQKKNYIKKSDKKKIFTKIADLTTHIKKSLLHGNIKEIGKLFHKHWLYKKKMTPLMSNNFIDKVYNFARKNGALGGKIIGAGGGGFILFIIDKRKKKLLRKKLIKFKLNEFDWNFNMKGTSVSKL